MKYFLVKVNVPEEYEDVDLELSFADFVDNPKAWDVELWSDDLKSEEIKE